MTYSKDTPCCSAIVLKRSISGANIFFIVSAQGLSLSLFPGLPFEFLGSGEVEYAMSADPSAAEDTQKEMKGD